jgi:hypothetical protein
VSAIKKVLTVGRGCYINQILIEITPIHLMSWCGLRTLRELSGADGAPYKNCFSLLPSSFFLTSVTSVSESVAELLSSFFYTIGVSDTQKRFYPRYPAASVEKTCAQQR